MTERKLIHIIDDEDAIRRSAGFMLKTSGYAVETWASGADFLKDARNAEHGCILLDIRMPGTNGVELCRQIRAIPGHKRTPIMMITAMTDRAYIDEAFAAGASDYLTKPIDAYQLVSLIRVWLGARTR